MGAGKTNTHTQKSSDTMNSKEKIEYMLHKVREKARISPAGFFFVDCNPFIDIKGNGGVPDEAEVLLSQLEQINILKKFQKDGLLFGVEFEKDRRGARVALMNLDKNSDENPYTQKQRKIENKETIKVSVHGGTLVLNKMTGFIMLNKIGSTLNPTGKEFKVVLTLATNKENLATYAELIGEGENKSKRRTLGFQIRNIKEGLGILPKKKAKNKDIIRNRKRYGYELITGHTRAQ